MQMTTEQAYERALAVVEELRQAGITVTIKPYSKKLLTSELIAKYSGPDRIAPEKWVNVDLTYETEEQRLRIKSGAKELNWLGITFDTGGTSKTRDWELDWSFHYTGVPDGERDAAQNEVEDLIEGAKDGA